MYIGLISDTHGLFDAPLENFLKPVDEIWHAGDFGGLETAQKIASFKPLKGVYGNCDGQDVRLDYPHHQLFDRCGMKVLMIHIGGYPGRYDPRARALIDEFHPDMRGYMASIPSVPPSDSILTAAGFMTWRSGRWTKSAARLNKGFSVRQNI